MLSLEDLAPGLLVRGVLPESAVTITSVRRFGAVGAEVAFVDTGGHRDRVLLCREHESGLELVDDECEWGFAAEASLWRVAATAREVLVNAYPGEVEDTQSRCHLHAFLAARDEGKLVDLVDELAAAPGFFYDSAVVPPLADLQAFFHEALIATGGQGSPLQGGRYEIAALPQVLSAPALPKQIAFSPELGAETEADWVHVQHPLVRELAQQILDEHDSLLKQGTVLIVPGVGHPRLGLLLEHGVGRLRDSGEGAWRQIERLEVDADGRTWLSPETSWWAYREPDADELATYEEQIGAWKTTALAEQAVAWAVAETVPLHLETARRAREDFARRLGAGSDVHGSAGSSDDIVLRNVLRERLQDWQQDPLLPLLPTVVGGALLIPERLLAAGETAAGTSVRIPRDLDEMTVGPVPGAPAPTFERSRKTEAERRANAADEGLFSEIPGLFDASREPSFPKRGLRVGLDRGTRPPTLIQSRGARVEADLQPMWQAHEMRLRAMGVEVDSSVELVRRNSVDGGLALWVPSGRFIMGERLGDGDEKPLHQVDVDEFHMDIYPVTQAQFQRFVRESGFRLGQWEARPDADDHPVVDVSWEDAVAYGQWAGKRLPTEAEWEKAARGTDGRTYPWGEEFEPDHACVLGRGFDGTAPVGSFPIGASPYGMLDMAGNVWEWIADYYADDYFNWCPLHNPYGPDTGEENVLRGGAWICHRRYLRCAKREHQLPGHRSRFAGFRCIG